MLFGRRMPRIPRPTHPLLDALRGLTRSVHDLKECMMANFDGLNGDVRELRQTVAETAARIERRLNEVLDDSVDQAATDAAAAEIREATAALKGIAPDPIDESDEPAGPSDQF